MRKKKDILVKVIEFDGSVVLSTRLPTFEEQKKRVMSYRYLFLFDVFDKEGGKKLLPPTHITLQSSFSMSGETLNAYALQKIKEIWQLFLSQYEWEEIKFSYEMIVASGNPYDVFFK
jgi:hypothetical protein